MAGHFRHRLLAMKDAEHALRAELIQSGEPLDGYPARLRQLHETNARELELILDDEGWPTVDSAEADGAEAAWLMVMQAVSRPSFMRRGLSLLKSAANHDEVPRHHAAMLEDRIRALEGRPQRYGTQLIFRDGKLSAPPIENEDEVDTRRASVGLAPLAETIATAREAALSDGAPPPEEWDSSSPAVEALAREVGWRE